MDVVSRYRARQRDHHGGMNGVNGTIKSDSNSSEKPQVDASKHDLPPPKKKPNMTTKSLWKRVKPKLDPPTLIFMLKGSLPTTVLLSLTQTSLWTDRYTTSGYIAAIVALFGMAFLPRAKFSQGIILSAIFSCLAAAITLLGQYCGIKARQATMSDPNKEGYNSSQAAVCAIFLFVDIWFFSMLRSKAPMLSTGCFLQNVFTMVELSYAPRAPNMTASIYSTKSLLEQFLLGQAAATAVSYVLFPMSTRTILFKQQHAYVGSLKNTIKLQSDCFGVLNPDNQLESVEQEVQLIKERSAALKKATYGLKMQYDKMLGDIAFAKRETSWGKLSANDISQLQDLFRKVMIPATGMSLVIEMLSGSASNKDDSKEDEPSIEDVPQVFGDKETPNEQQKWIQTFAMLREPFQELARDLDRGLHHAALRLEFEKIKKPKRVDAEAKGDTIEPGDEGFTQAFERRIEQFISSRNAVLGDWKKQHNIEETSTDIGEISLSQIQSERKVLVLFLFLGRLGAAMAHGINNIDRFADSKVTDGTMKKNRLIYPSAAQLRNWLMALWSKSEGSLLSAPDGNDAYRGGLHGQARNPEHLPPSNAWEKYSDYLRKVAHLFQSPESVFGFRVAMATMSGTIMAFLRQTHDFYFDQRIIWSIIVIVVGWHMTAGQSFFALLGRVIMTLVGMTFCWLAYYIPDGIPGGNIPLIWFGYFILMYFIRNYPQFAGAMFISAITMTSVTGNKLIEKKIGSEPFHKSGEVIYPMYELAPYRALIVTIGCAIAFFWTIFPYPITERHVLRQELGTALYDLTIYHDCCQAIIITRLQGTSGDENDEHSEGRELDKVRTYAFDHLRRLLPSIRGRLNFHKYELPVGGRFPQERYAAILGRIVSLLDCTAQMAHATNPAGDGSFALLKNSGPEWEQEVTIITQRLDESARQISFVMTILSGTIKEGVPLPPFFQAPEPFGYPQMHKHLQEDINEDGSLHLGNAYSTFAIIRIMSELLCAELDRLIGDVRELVGEVNYIVRQ